LAWGFATTWPFAAIIAITTVIGLLFSSEPKRVPWTRETVLLLLFSLWMLFTTTQALNPPEAWAQCTRVLKIQFMTFMTLVLMTNRKRLQALIWAIVLSLGFF